MKKILLMVGLCFGIAACSEETKQDLGLKNVAPDEFSVITRAPLSVPPDYALRPPRPGSSRPMEISTKDQARQTVFGVKDVTRSGSVKTDESDAKGFLDKVGATKADSNIRDIVDAEDPVDNRTTAERLLFLKGDKDGDGDPIDPEEEFERLKKEGVVTIKKRNEDIEAP